MLSLFVYIILKGQITDSVNSLLEVEANNIHVALLPTNATDLLQLMDIAVNKPAKDFLKCKFKQWYPDEITKQLEGIEAVEIQPVNMFCCNEGDNSKVSTYHKLWSLDIGMLASQLLWTTAVNRNKKRREKKTRWEGKRLIFSQMKQ